LTAAWYRGRRRRCATEARGPRRAERAAEPPAPSLPFSFSVPSAPPWRIRFAPRTEPPLSSRPMPTLAPNPALLAETSVSSYLPVFIIILMAISFAVANVGISRILGPGRQGRTKGLTYESGMTPVGTARKRFNVRFYLIAVVFLVFDVEIIFL